MEGKGVVSMIIQITAEAKLKSNHENSSIKLFFGVRDCCKTVGQQRVDVNILGTVLSQYRAVEQQRVDVNTLGTVL